jgi:hypothetical protein
MKTGVPSLTQSETGKLDTYAVTVLTARKASGSICLLHVIGPSGDDVTRLCQAQDADIKRRLSQGEEPVLERENLGTLFCGWSFFTKMKKGFVEVAKVDGFRVFVRVTGSVPVDTYPELFRLLWDDDEEEGA